MHKNALGQKGEAFAAKFLQGRGMRILARNYTSPYGEIDIVADGGGVICFVEVKTRRRGGMVNGVEAVTAAKRRRIVASAIAYLQENPCDLQPRFDVCSIVADAFGEVVRYDYLTGAFDGEGNI